MILAHELRIGNWVLVNGKYVRVESIDDNGINQEIEGDYYGGWITNYEGRFYDWYKNQSDTIQPIPLTEELLLKCGFDLKGFYWDFPGDDSWFSVCKFDDGRFMLAVNNEYEVLEIKHLHQLQNLYFCLTGEELKIEL